MTVLSYVSLITRDLDRLADFYGDLFALEEIAASRSGKYREFVTGGSKLGFLYSGAYAMLRLPPRVEPGPVSQVLTFAVGEREAVFRITEAAIVSEAVLVKPPFETFFGQIQSVLLDPEGNAFRISAPV